MQHLRHVGHTILSSVGHHAWPLNVANATLLTAAAIGLAEHPDVVGIVGAAGGLFEPADVARMRNIVRGGELPVQLWVQFAFRKPASGVTITTRGLAAFFDYEIEVWDAPKPLEDVADLEQVSSANRDRVGRLEDLRRDGRRLPGVRSRLGARPQLVSYPLHIAALL